MKRLSVLLLLAACGTSPAPETPAAEVPAAGAPAAAPVAQKAAPDDASWKYFGAPFAVSEVVPASTVLADPAGFAGKPVRMEGELTEVCQKAGCWAVVRDDAGRSLRVTMKDHAFGIDKDTQGRACQLEGELVKKAVDPEKLAHFAEEGAKEHPELSSAAAGKTEAWELVASGVAVARVQ
jgi:hypothetical protein